MSPFLLYIDPGTGSMLFTLAIGLAGAALYSAKNLFIKLKYSLIGKGETKDKESNIPFAIFSDSKIYWKVFEPVCDEFEKRKIKLKYLTASSDDPALSKNYEYVDAEFAGEGNKTFVKMNMLKADIVLSTTPGLDVYQWKRSKDVKYYVHLPHAATDPGFGYRMFGLDYYDAVLLSGDYQIDQIREIEAKRNLKPKEIDIVGVTYMDELLKKLNSIPKQEQKEEKTVLLAPSWGKSAILTKYGEKIFDALLGTGYNIIVRPHPQSLRSEKELIDTLMKKYPNSNKLSWNFDNDNFDVLNKSDILISDFSGVVFDFSLVFDKPIIYADTSYDSSPYDSAWSDDGLWTFKTLPKIGKQLNEDNINDIKELIDSCIESDDFKQARNTAREETWANRGNATTAVVDYLVNKHKQLEEKENANINNAI